MGRSKKDKFESGMEGFNEPTYDSDVELDDETLSEIKKKKQKFNNVAADEIRKEAWEKAGVFPKLKRALKTPFFGDKREKTEEQQKDHDNEVKRRKKLYGGV